MAREIEYPPFRAGDKTLGGKMVVDQNKGVILIYDDSNPPKLIMKVGNVGPNAKGKPRYGILFMDGLNERMFIGKEEGGF